MPSFDIEKFRKLYPYLGDVTDEQLEAYWTLATAILGQYYPGGKVPDDIYEMMLYLMVCHLATLGLRGDGSVGVLQSATQGKVSASFKPYNNITWYSQTQCGSFLEKLILKFVLGARFYPGNHC